MRTVLLVVFLSLLAQAQDSDPKVLIRSAQAKMKSGDFKGAEADASRAIEVGGKSAKACYVRGSCRMAIQDFEGAVSDFTDAIDLGDKRVAAYTLRGMARY